MWWLPLVGAAHAACDRASLRDALAQVDAAFGALDLVGLRVAADEAARTLGCMPDAVDASEAGAYHRMKALTAFADGDVASASLALVAAHTVWPSWTLPDAWAGPGHPLRLAWERAVTAPEGTATAAPPPAAGWLVVDGARGATVPDARPYLFQLVGADGIVEVAAWVPAGRLPPDYAVVAPPPLPEPTLVVAPAPPAAAEAPVPRKEAVQRGLIAAGLAVGVASAGVLGGAWVARGDYDDAVVAGDAVAIERTHRWTNALSVTAGVLAGGGGLLVVGGLL